MPYCIHYRLNFITLYLSCTARHCPSKFFNSMPCIALNYNALPCPGPALALLSSCSCFASLLLRAKLRTKTD